MKTEFIQFLDLKRENDSFEPHLSQAVQNVMSKGWYIGGEENEFFESNWANYCGTKFAVGVSNGLDALELILRAYEIGPGDSVIVPSNTYIATWLAITAVGAQIIPVEPCPQSFNISADNIETAIVGNTKAVLGVHLYGRSMDHTPIMKLCEQRGLIFIEDAAQAHGAISNGVRVGAQGHAAAFSFYPGKNLGALGDGGAVTTSDKAIADKIKLLRNYGSVVKYQNEIMGKNCRLDTIHAAVLDLKLKSLDSSNSKRRAIASYYSEYLANIDDLCLPSIPEEPIEHVWHLFVVQTENRDKLQEYLKKDNIGTLSHYPIPPYSQNAYKHLKFAASNFPISTQIHKNCLSLPISATHKNIEIERVCESVRRFFSNTP